MSKGRSERSGLMCLSALAAAAAVAALMPGCYESSGNDFRHDGREDGARDPAADDPAWDDPAMDDLAMDDPAADPEPDDLPEVIPPVCDTPPIEVAMGVEFMGDASPRVQGTMVYDARRDRMLVFGGLRGSGDYTSEVVVIHPATNQMGVLGYEGTRPAGWTAAGGAWDEAGDRIFIVGGMVAGDFSSRVIEIRTVSDALFAARSLPDTPDGRWRSPAAGYDPVGGRLVVFGGYDGTIDAGYNNKTWVIRPDVAGDGWRELEGAGGSDPQEYAVMTWVPSFGLVLLAIPQTTGVWWRQILVMRQGSEVWEEIMPDPIWPPGNTPAVFWDSEACRLIVWGGGCTEQNYSVDLFASPARVTQIEIPLFGVLPRVFMNAGLDVARRQVVLHGGYDCEVNVFRTDVERLLFE